MTAEAAHTAESVDHGNGKGSIPEPKETGVAEETTTATNKRTNERSNREKKKNAQDGAELSGSENNAHFGYVWWARKPANVSVYHSERHWPVSAYKYWARVTAIVDDTFLKRV